MTIRKTNFKQLRLNNAQFADGETESGRDDMRGILGDDNLETAPAPGEILSLIHI